MILKPHELYQDLLKSGKAVAGFTVFDLPSVRGVLAGAARKNSAVVLQITVQIARLWGMEMWRALIEQSKKHGAEVLWHLEGGDSDLVRDAVEAGFNSVKVQWFNENRRGNLEQLIEVVRFAKDRGVWVEGEPVRLPSGGGSMESALVSLTDTDKAKFFLESVGPDALAVSIGATYGAFTGIEYVRFDLVEKLEKELPGVVLTSGGGSGVAGSQLKKLARSNVCKITFGTSVAQAWQRAVKSEGQDFADGREMASLMSDASLAVQLDVEEKIGLVRD